MPTTLLPSILRTVVPLVVGWLIAQPIVDALDLTEVQVTTAVTAVVTAVYYIVSRLIEVYVAPRLGGFLIGLRPGVAPQSYTGRHVRRDDLGAARPLLLVPVVVVLLAAAAVLTADAASAHRPHQRPAAAPVQRAPEAAVVAPSVTRTMVCDGGTLVVNYNGIVLGPGKTWQPLQDDGSTRLELLEGSGRSGPGGMWLPIRGTTSGGEHALRWRGWQDAANNGLHFVLARVVTNGYRSTGFPIDQTCPVA